MKYVINFCSLIAFSSALFASTQLSAHEPCVQLREDICPHKIIRSIKSQQLEFNHKALCICIADFKPLLTHKMPEPEQQLLFNKIKKKYAMNQQTFLKLLFGG